MRVLLILAHPDQRSFNHAIAQAAANQLVSDGHEVYFHDLYAEHFDPILPKEELPWEAALPEDIARHCHEIQSAEGIVIVHPNWWGQLPAILKGWVDRVLRPKVAYKFVESEDGEGIPLGLLKAKKAVVFNTANTAAERELAVFGNPLEGLWKRCIFTFCGIPDIHREAFAPVITSTPRQRKDWLERVKEVIGNSFPPAATPPCTTANRQGFDQVPNEVLSGGVRSQHVVGKNRSRAGQMEHESMMKLSEYE